MDRDRVSKQWKLLKILSMIFCTSWKPSWVSSHWRKFMVHHLAGAFCGKWGRPPSAWCWERSEVGSADSGNLWPEGLPAHCNHISWDNTSSSHCSWLMVLVYFQTGTIIEMLMSSSEHISFESAAREPGKGKATDADTLLRILCHRKDRGASKFLKKHYHLPKSSGEEINIIIFSGPVIFQFARLMPFYPAPLALETDSWNRLKQKLRHNLRHSSFFNIFFLFLFFLTAAIWVIYMERKIFSPLFWDNKLVYIKPYNDSEVGLNKYNDFRSPEFCINTEYIEKKISYHEQRDEEPFKCSLAVLAESVTDYGETPGKAYESKSPLISDILKKSTSARWSEKGQTSFRTMKQRFREAASEIKYSPW